MMKECDSNDSDTIDFQEFCTLMVTRMNDIDDPIVLEEAFQMFDKDGNGQISRAELRLAFQNILQTTEEDLPLTEMEDMLREFDRNGDGNINFAEFKQYMMED
ncbi:calmodulin [Chrysochromulina tobinii]|uniref:Calmodulin n=1 Tax=Chrysochromulina tobinii TaxID=1460289 RepID=A0A0M0LQY7_9EUKA|nr:calmodulin [Chrysochromulina tobinii]|eukprot:KOO53158.1 calmodulin [Chrysochromulina sp. CCMP291]